MREQNEETKEEKYISQDVLESLDAVIAAPEQHKVVFENERVRIIEFKVKPGEVVPTHTHRWASINYVVRLSDFLSFDLGGNLKLDSRSGQFGTQEGEVFCLPPFPPLHSVENIGTREIHAVSVELKEE